MRLSAKFYLVAMLFVIFDLEGVFIFLWAMAGRELGWAGYCEELHLHWRLGRRTRVSLEGGGARLVSGGSPPRRRP